MSTTDPSPGSGTVRRQPSVLIRRPSRGLSGPPPATAPGYAFRARPSLLVALVVAVIPAYLLPALSVTLNTLVIPDQEFADQLAVAAWTTIAVPSAAASALVTLWTHGRTPPRPPGARRSARAFAVAAVISTLLAGAGSAVLIGNGVLPVSALQYTLPSAALGGGLAARRWARTHRALPRVTAPTDHARPHVLRKTDSARLSCNLRSTTRKEAP